MRGFFINKEKMGSIVEERGNTYKGVFEIKAGNIIDIYYGLEGFIRES